MSAALPESPLASMPGEQDEKDVIDLAELWLHVGVIVDDLCTAMAAEPDLTARRKLVHDALRKVRREIHIDGCREVQRLLPLLALTESVLP